MALKQRVLGILIRLLVFYMEPVDIIPKLSDELKVWAVRLTIMQEGVLILLNFCVIIIFLFFRCWSMELLFYFAIQTAHGSQLKGVSVYPKYTNRSVSV